MLIYSLLDKASPYAQARRMPALSERLIYIPASSRVSSALDQSQDQSSMALRCVICRMLTHQSASHV